VACRNQTRPSATSRTCPPLRRLSLKPSSAGSAQSAIEKTGPPGGPMSPASWRAGGMEGPRPTPTIISLEQKVRRPSAGEGLLVSCRQTVAHLRRPSTKQPQRQSQNRRCNSPDQRSGITQLGEPLGWTSCHRRRPAGPRRADRQKRQPGERPEQVAGGPAPR